MSNAFIGLLLAVGVGGWVFSKVSQRTGGSNQKAASAAVIAGILAFMIMLTALGAVTN